MIPEAGRRFGPYEIQSRLGGGGMGHVFRAWDSRLHREVAVKLLNHEYAMAGMRERFLREARAASALNHPNICSVFDIGEQDGDPYLVMELLKGETLRDRILSRTMQVDEITAIARETAEALDAAHTKGVVHRDIKPANIFLVEKPNGATQAKVLDFGLAKIEGGVLGSRGRSLDITTAGATVGTLAYMSPEQARGEVLDSRSDLFSLGVVMYEMATRQVPFQGATSALVFVQLLNHAPEPVREWNEAVPRELEKIIFKLLAKERTARFQTARELELALLGLSDKGGGGGWLRKAVSTVPLVRAPDPVARARRLARTTDPSSGASLEPERLSTRPASPDPSARTPPASDQFLRPVARVPRGDSTPQSQASKSNPDASPAGVSESSSRGSTPGLGATDQPGGAEVSTTNSARRASVSLGASGDQGDLPDRRRAVPAESLPVDQETDETPSRSIPVLHMSRTPRRFRMPLQAVWLAIGSLIVLVVGLLLFLFLNHSRFGGSLLSDRDPVVIAEIENRTGNSSLDDSVAEGLRLDLAQSPWMRVRGTASYLAARRQIAAASTDGKPKNGSFIARQAAQRLGAKAYVYGVINGSNAPYLLHVDLRDVGSNDVLTSAEARADSLQQIPGAIDTIAGELRASAGEEHLSREGTSTALAREGTANLAAVQLFAQAELSVADHQPVAAVADLQQAVSLDPKFVQAHLLLVSLYDQLRAETSAADAARHALAASDVVGDRTRILAQASYETEASGDLVRASGLLRQLISAYPHDSDARAALAGTLRMQGHMAEALQVAQDAYTDDPYNAAAYLQAENALVGLDRYDAAFQVDSQAQRLGISRPAESLAVAILDGRQDIVDQLAAEVPVGKMEFRPDWSYGIYLDSGGRLAAGETLWRSRAEAARQNESLRSAGAFLLAQGALDRALVEDCDAALTLAGEVERDEPHIGRAAYMNLGMTDALCGQGSQAREVVRRLHELFPQSFELNAFGLSDIEAAIALHDHDPGAALNLLKQDRAYDLISLSPYLRGRAHLELHQAELGIIDFQTILSHRGGTFLVGNDAYPVAQAGVARAFADAGDTASSGQAYRKFLEFWRHADPSIPMLVEARLHAGK